MKYLIFPALLFLQVSLFAQSLKEVDNPTVIRADEVILKDGEACTVSFPGNMPAGTYIIRVNAVSMDHSAGSAMYYFRKK
jgi:hypothetical protein